MKTSNSHKEQKPKTIIPDLPKSLLPRRMTNPEGVMLVISNPHMTRIHHTPYRKPVAQAGGFMGATSIVVITSHKKSSMNAAFCRGEGFCLVSMIRFQELQLNRHYN